MDPRNSLVMIVDKTSFAWNADNTRSESKYSWRSTVRTPLMSEGWKCQASTGPSMQSVLLKAPLLGGLGLQIIYTCNDYIIESNED